MTGRVCVGTCGWTFPDWRGVFYPDRLPARGRFGFYARAFEAVEVNSTFYHPAGAATFRAWLRQAPPGFVYALKMNQQATHYRPADPGGVVRDFLARAAVLGEHLGPILYQLPPWRRHDGGWLRDFLRLLPAGFRHVLEFRHPSWYATAVRDALDEAGVSTCVHDMRGSAAPPDWVTGPVAYLRLHGAGAVKYAGRYDPARLHAWAAWAAAQACSRDVFVFFNNTIAAAAAADAGALRAVLGQSVPA